MQFCNKDTCPIIAVSAGLIHTMQFHLPRTVATVLNQGLGYGFNLKIPVFMHWNEIQGCLGLDFFLLMTLIFSVNLLYCPFLAVSLPGRYKYDTNHMRISDTELFSSILVVFL